MEFTFETTYDRRSMTALARCLRKTLRAKRSRRSHIVGWSVCVLGLFLLVGNPSVVTFLAVVTIGLALLFEDSINGYFAWRRLLPGTEHGTVIFRDDAYTSRTAIGESTFHYDVIAGLAETRDYFVFSFNQSHAQLYEKATLQGGSEEAFRAFLEEKTGKEFQRV